MRIIPQLAYEPRAKRIRNNVPRYGSDILILSQSVVVESGLPNWLIEASRDQRLDPADDFANIGVVSKLDQPMQMVRHQYKGKRRNRTELVLSHQNPNGYARQSEVRKYRCALPRGGDDVIDLTANGYPAAA
jgi:hypothetical protein